MLLLPQSLHRSFDLQLHCDVFFDPKRICISCLQALHELLSKTEVDLTKNTLAQSYAGGVFMNPIIEYLGATSFAQHSLSRTYH